MVRMHGSSSVTNKCAFCNLKTSTSITFGGALSICVWVCREHEELLRENNIKCVNDYVDANIKIIRKTVGQFIKHE